MTWYSWLALGLLAFGAAWRLEGWRAAREWREYERRRDEERDAFLDAWRDPTPPE